MNKLHSAQALTIADQLKLSTPAGLHHSSRRSNRFIPAAGGSLYSPSGVSTMLFNIPSTIQWADASHSFLEFNAYGTGTSTPVFDKSIQSIFRRCTLRLANGMVLEDITNANQLFHCITDVTYDNEVETGVAALKEGFGSVAQRTIYFASGKSYTINLGKLFGSWATDKYLPISLMGGLQVQIELESAAQAVISGSAATYTVDSPTLNIECLEFSDELNAMVLQQWRTSGLWLKFSSYQEYTYTSSSATDNINIRPYHKSAKTIVVAPRYTATQNQQTSGSMSRCYDNISQVTLSVDNSQNPTERTFAAGNNDSSIFISDIQRAFNSEVRGTGLAPTTFTKLINATSGTTFLMAFDLQAIPNPNMISGVNCEQINLQVVSAATSGSVLYNAYLEHDVMCRISQQNGVEVFK